jgi:hypothetical protein
MKNITEEAKEYCHKKLQLNDICCMSLYTCRKQFPGYQEIATLWNNNGSIPDYCDLHFFTQMNNVLPYNALTCLPTAQEFTKI